MLITIIVAVFNAAGNLQRCISSVAGQTYPFKELIVMDGGSTDGSVDIIKNNGKFISYWESKQDSGIYHAWNKALDHVNGDWICFLGADDCFYDSNVLDNMSRYLMGCTLRVVYGSIHVTNKKGDILETLGDPWSDVKEKFKQTMCIPHPGMMFHRNLFDIHGRFDESFRIAGDYEFLLRELLSSDALFVPGLIVATMELGGVSLSPASSTALLRETRRAQTMHGLRIPGFVQIMATLRVKIRLALWCIIGEKKTRSFLDWGRQLLGKPPYWTRT